MNITPSDLYRMIRKLQRQVEVAMNVRSDGSVVFQRSKYGLFAYVPKDLGGEAGTPGSQFILAVITGGGTNGVYSWKSVTVTGTGSIDIPSEGEGRLEGSLGNRAARERNRNPNVVPGTVVWLTPGQYFGSSVVTPTVGANPVFTSVGDRDYYFDHSDFIINALLDGFSVSTTLDGDIDNSTSSMTVTSDDGFPQIGEFRVRIDDEVIHVFAGNGTTSWSIQRGEDGTIQGAHTDGTTVTLVAHWGWHEATSNLIDNGWVTLPGGLYGDLPIEPAREREYGYNIPTGTPVELERRWADIDPLAGKAATGINTLKAQPGPVTYTLTADTLTTDGFIQLATATGYITPDQLPTYGQLEAEIIRIISITSTDATSTVYAIDRALFGTSTANHLTGATVSIINTLNLRQDAQLPATFPTFYRIGQETIKIIGLLGDDPFTGSTNLYAVERGKFYSTPAAYSAGTQLSEVAYLTAPVTKTASSISVNERLAFPSSYPFMVRVENEFMKVYSDSGPNLSGPKPLNVARGMFLSYATSHDASIPVTNALAEWIFERKEAPPPDWHVLLDGGRLTGGLHNDTYDERGTGDSGGDVASNSLMVGGGISGGFPVWHSRRPSEAEATTSSPRWLNLTSESSEPFRGPFSWLPVQLGDIYTDPIGYGFAIACIQAASSPPKLSIQGGAIGDIIIGVGDGISSGFTTLGSVGANDGDVLTLRTQTILGTDYLVPQWATP